MLWHLRLGLSHLDLHICNAVVVIVVVTEK